jgi:hypothetical protein
MPRLAYEKKRFRDDTKVVIARAIQVCEEYARQGYDLTLRQLYYQFVARGFIPNTQRDYKRLGGIVNDARMAGLLDWDYIVDRTRNLDGNSHWRSPAHIIRDAYKSYAVDKWDDQDHRVEVWVEKEALAGVIERAARGLDVDFFSCRGYVSQSEMWRAGQRLLQYVRDGKHVVILHLGDHDPSGIDMTRDIEDRLFTFIGSHLASDYGGSMTYGEYSNHVTVERVALNWDQVQTYNPPPNPVKISDSRAQDYISRFGPDSWELDALDPVTLGQIISDAVEQYLDRDRWDEAVEREQEEVALLTLASQRWADVAAYLDGQPSVDSEEGDEVD